MHACHNIAATRVCADDASRTQHRLWTDEAQRKELTAANLTFRATEDESESVFLASKVADYRDTANEEPFWDAACPDRVCSLVSLKFKFVRTVDGEYQAAVCGNSSSVVDLA